MKITIIIPTHNEGESIGALLNAVFSELAKMPQHTWSILIVDGKSTDNTLDIVRTFKNVHVISEKEKRGLGYAYITGMNYAIDTLHADAFLEFDGDFQHDPKDIPKLVRAFDEGYEYIIGSRYVEGGTIPQEWPWYRKFLSNFGNLIIHYGLGIKTHDNTSGFKMTSTKFKDKLPLKPGEVLSLRHAYKIHFLYAMISAGAKTTEVPIHFLNRNKGVSKSTAEDIIESLKVVYLLRFRKNKD